MAHQVERYADVYNLYRLNSRARSLVDDVAACVTAMSGVAGKAERALYRALVSARLTGGALVTPHPEMLIIADASEFSATTWNADPNSLWFRTPTAWLLRRGDIESVIPAAEAIYFCGNRVLPSMRCANRGCDDSVLIDFRETFDIRFEVDRCRLANSYAIEDLKARFGVPKETT